MKKETRAKIITISLIISLLVFFVSALSGNETFITITITITSALVIIGLLYEEDIAELERISIKKIRNNLKSAKTDKRRKYEN